MCNLSSLNGLMQWRDCGDAAFHAGFGFVSYKFMKGLLARSTLGTSTAMIRIGFYSGSFDPVTLGHTDVIMRAARLVDRLVIGIGVNAGKSPMFTEAERVAMLEIEARAITKATETRIDITTFSNLAIDAARQHGASVIFRGLRDGTDFDYEMQMSGMNGAMASDIQTVFVSASPHVRHIAANLVRAVTLMGGDPSPFVSKDVAKRLHQKALEV